MFPVNRSQAKADATAHGSAVVYTVQKPGRTSLIRDLLALMGCELAGEVLQHALGLPVPGPVFGLVLLLLLLVACGGPSHSLQSNAQALLKYLPLMFVPAGAGIEVHAALIRSEWLPILAGVVGSSVIAILTTAFTMRAVERCQGRESSLAPPLRAGERS